MDTFRPGGARRRGDAGQAASDYLGVLVVVVTVVALVAGVLVTAGGSPIATSIGNAICSITGIGCGDAGTGASGTGTSTTPTADTADDDGGDDDESCSGFLGCTWSGIKTGGKFVGSLGYNVGKGVVDDVKGIGSLITNPGSLIDAGKYLFTNPGDALKQLVWDDETQAMADDGDWGGVIGRELWNVGSLFIPGVDIAKVGAKTGAVGRIAARLAELAKLGDKASDAAKAARLAVARGDKAAADAAAKEARQAADDAATKAREAGCPISAGLPRQRRGAAVLALADTEPRGPGLFSAPLPVAAAPVAVGMVASACSDAGDAARKADADADAAEQAAGECCAIVPGGGLTAQEAAGGHTLARHVGKTDQDLLDRLAAQPGITAASTFTDRTAAEAAVSSALAKDPAGIQAWLDGSSNANKVIVMDTGSVTGRSAPRGATDLSQVQDVTGVRVVLKKKPGTPPSYYVLTSYPEKIQ